MIREAIKKVVRLSVIAALLVVLSACAKETTGDVPKETEFVPTAVPATPSPTAVPATPVPTETSLPAAKTFDYSSYAQAVVNKVELSHPIFLLEGALPEDYDAACEAYLNEAKTPITRTEFLLATQKYFTIFHDGHMGNGLLGDFYLVNAALSSDGQKLYLLGEDGAFGDEIIRIGGVLAQDVMKTVDTYFFAENDAARKRFYAMRCRQEEMLQIAGCSYSRDEGVTVTTLSADGQETDTVFAMFPLEAYLAQQETRATYVIKHEMIDDVFYIDFKQCVWGEEIDATVEAIRRALQEGTEKFIIDVRGNGGGDSEAARELLKALDMEVPGYGVYVRTGEELLYYAPNVETAVRNERVKLAVLTDSVTFSSAVMFAVWVGDGGLGVIIGEPVVESPTSFGDIRGFKVGLSDEQGVELAVSIKRFLRPDTNADQENLFPDIACPAKDALQNALEYMRQ